MNETRQDANRVRSATEAKEIDFVTVLVLTDPKLIGGKDVVIEAVAGRQAQHGYGILPELRPWIRSRGVAPAVADIGEHGGNLGAGEAPPASTSPA
jgi:hypothetical protein